MKLHSRRLRFVGRSSLLPIRFLIVGAACIMAVFDCGCVIILESLGTILCGSSGGGELVSLFASRAFALSSFYLR